MFECQLIMCVVLFFYVLTETTIWCDEVLFLSLWFFIIQSVILNMCLFLIIVFFYMTIILLFVLYLIRSIPLSFYPQKIFPSSKYFNIFIREDFNTFIIFDMINFAAYVIVTEYRPQKSFVYIKIFQKNTPLKSYYLFFYFCLDYILYSVALLLSQGMRPISIYNGVGNKVVGSFTIFYLKLNIFYLSIIA